MQCSMPEVYPKPVLPFLYRTCKRRYTINADAYSDQAHFTHARPQCCRLLLQVMLLNLLIVMMREV